MKKVTGFTFLFLGIFQTVIIAGCQKRTEKNTKTSLEAKVMQETEGQPQERKEVIFVLATQQLIDNQRQLPSSFYVKGILENNRFIPKSPVLGTGELAKEGRYGWLELTSKQFFPMESDRKANTPFVKGYMTDKGFIPSVREVFDDR